MSTIDGRTLNKITAKARERLRKFREIRAMDRLADALQSDASERKSHDGSTLNQQTLKNIQKAYDDVAATGKPPSQRAVAARSGHHRSTVKRYWGALKT